MKLKEIKSLIKDKYDETDISVSFLRKKKGIRIKGDSEKYKGLFDYTALIDIDENNVESLQIKNENYSDLNIPALIDSLFYNCAISYIEGKNEIPIFGKPFFSREKIVFDNVLKALKLCSIKSNISIKNRKEYLNIKLSEDILKLPKLSNFFNNYYKVYGKFIKNEYVDKGLLGNDEEFCEYYDTLEADDSLLNFKFNIKGFSVISYIKDINFNKEELTIKYMVVNTVTTPATKMLQLSFEHAYNFNFDNSVMEEHLDSIYKSLKMKSLFHYNPDILNSLFKHFGFEDSYDNCDKILNKIINSGFSYNSVLSEVSDIKNKITGVVNQGIMDINIGHRYYKVFNGYLAYVRNDIGYPRSEDFIVNFLKTEEELKTFFLEKFNEVISKNMKFVHIK